jgi:hypothetical protein
MRKIQPVSNPISSTNRARAALSSVRMSVGELIGNCCALVVIDPPGIKANSPGTGLPAGGLGYKG